MAGADFLPVVQRELREGARRPFNYWLRVAGAAAGVALLYVINQSENGDQAAEGLRLFTGLHEMLLALICVMVPAMSADCITREKREGTLGLLFLTPLTAMGIVAGKGLVQAFRAFTLWLAVLPVIIIPFLSGGVTGGDVFSAITIEFCVTLLCLAAGILASTLARARSTAFVLAACFGVAFVGLFGGLLGLGFFWQTGGPGLAVPLTQIFISGQSPRRVWLTSKVHVPFAQLLSSGQSLITGESSGSPFAGGYFGPILPTFSLATGSPSGSYMSVNGPNGLIRIPYIPGRSSVQSPSGWSRYFAAPASRIAWRSLLLESLLAVPLLFLLVLRFAARRMASSWQDQPPSLRHESWIRTFCVPLARRRFARKMQRTLDWNPIAWLQQYSWKARTSKWGLCLGLVLIECEALTGNPAEILEAQSVLALILAAAFTFVSVSSFLTEKKSGALELLLVTPVTPNQIIFGRVWGLWKQFLPAGLALLLVSLAAQYLVYVMYGSKGSALSVWTQYAWGYQQNRGITWSLLTSPLSFGNSRTFPVSNGAFVYDNVFYLIDNPVFQIFVTAIGFLTLPVFATYLALRVKNLIVAAALTWVTLLLCPFSAFSVIAFLREFFHAQVTLASLYLGVSLAILAFALLACFLLRHSLSRRIYSF
jgi:ABC-type Na+ efflux pump permease subunit